MSKESKYESGEYTATSSHILPAIIKKGNPDGYVCMKCGHLVAELDPILDDLCLICLKDWAIKSGVTRLIPIVDAIQQEALEYSKKHPCDNNKSRQDATTVYIKNKNS